MAKLKTLFISFIIIIFTLFISFIFYNSFLKSKSETLINLEVSYDKNGNYIKDSNLLPFTDEEAEQLKSYKFKIKNNSDIDVTYELLLQDIILNDESKKALTRNQLRYQLILNNNIIAKDNMKSIKQNIIDKRVVKKQGTNNYEIKIWIAQQAYKTDWMNKYYKYKIIVKGIKGGK